jgi:hypothetical protein
MLKKPVQVKPTSTGQNIAVGAWGFNLAEMWK